MEKYAQKIMSVLTKNNIPSIFDEQDRVIYAYYENNYGEIYGIYEYENTRIIGCAIYSCPIPEQRREQILEYLALSDTNREKNKGVFFLDRQTGCIAFGVDYPLDKEGIEDDMAIFEEFCMKPYTMFIQHQQLFYEIIKQ